VQAGDLRNNINIEHLVTGGSDGIGNVLNTWAVLYRSVPAQVIAFGGRETWVGDGAQSQTTHRILIRYLSPLTSQMRVTLNGRVMDIVGIVNDEQHRTTSTLDVKENFSPGIPAVA